MNHQYSWTVDVPASPTLGYVYPEAGPSLVPVYAVGVTPGAPEIGWREARSKIYTTDANERTTLLGKGGRDDGIAFYVPSAASAATETVYHSTAAAVQFGPGETQYYFTGADMASHAKDSTPPAPAFQVLSAQATGTKPLMTTFYKPGPQHTELSVGKERFARASNQGPGPLWHLEWSGITEPLTLVVEALATGCPFQGLLSPKALSAPPHQAFSTLAELAAASSTGEVYLNGEHDLPGASWTNISLKPATENLPMMRTPNASPVPIARSFIEVAPQPHDPKDWDWYQGFSGADLGTVTEMPGCTDTNCDRWKTPALDISSYRIDQQGGVSVVTFGTILGQLVTAFDDWGQDVTGKIRMTALQKTAIDPDPAKFLHVTMSVNIVSSDRRYPQMIISNQDAPVQENFASPDAESLLIQPILGPSMRFELQAIHGLFNGNGTGNAAPWDVNNQAPEHRLVDYDGWKDKGKKTIPPAEPPFEHAGVDRMTKLDVYVSSGRLYLFVDGTPAACTLYPNGFAIGGPVTVTFGDVLYHEGAPDEGVCSAAPKPYVFMYEHQCIETRREWDDLAFKAGVQAPKWDDANFPCDPY